MAQASFVKLPLLLQTTYARLVDMLLTAEAGDPNSGATLVAKTILEGHLEGQPARPAPRFGRWPAPPRITTMPPV